jgi:hypothetical protein
VRHTCNLRDSEGVRQQLGEAAGDVMGRLGAASMESYPRAYPSLVRLHMLQVPCPSSAASHPTAPDTSTSGGPAPSSRLRLNSCNRKPICYTSVSHTAQPKCNANESIMCIRHQCEYKP